MHKLIRVICILAISSATVTGQETITIDSCIHWAKENYPLFRQNAVTSQLLEQNEKAVRENWLPKLSFMAQATYNTEVVQFNFPGMNIDFPHDPYMTALSLEQTLIDGGRIKAQGNIERTSSEITIRQNEVELYKLVERINQLYINILLGRENINVLQLYKEDLENRAKNIRLGVENGMVLSSALDELSAEILKTEQNIDQSVFQLLGLYKTLSLYTGKEINDQTELMVQPIGGEAIQLEINRPEMKLFDLQTTLLEQRYKLINKNAIPTLSLGASGNYGRPGPNFINQDLRFFGSANLTLRWNISSLYGLNREKTKLELNKSLVELQKEAFLFNIQASLNTQTSQLEAYSRIIEKDNEIIEKRQRVTATASSQMENGKITVVNYLSQLNAELQATLNKKVHEIQRMNLISSINATSGSFNF